jgi:transcriptional regulator with XRE-family HTH domain
MGVRRIESGASMSFATRLKAACLERYGPKYKQKDLAQAVGVSAPTMSNYLRGELLPSMDTAITISHEIGVSVEWLLTGRGDKYPPTSGSLVEMRAAIKRLDEKGQLQLLSEISSLLADR